MAQSYVSGKILSESNAALANVKVKNSASSGVVYSDSLGNFRVLYVPKKKNTLTFEHPQYKSYVEAIPVLFDDEDYKLDVVLNSNITEFVPTGITIERKKGTIELKPMNSRPSLS